MADKFKDAEDRWLESMLRDEAIADDGFSERVMGKLRRRIWLRRLLLPLAMVLGGLLALKPASQLADAMLRIASLLPDDIVELPLLTMSQAPLLLISCVMVPVAVLFFRMLEE